MKPPICAICRKDFRKSIGEGGTVSFRLTEEDQAFNQRMKDERMVGHPAGLHWFCGEHYPIAQKYKHLNWAEARKAIKNDSGFLGRLKDLFD